MKTKTNKKLLLVCIVALILAITFIATPAKSAFAEETTVYYYIDATYEGDEGAMYTGTQGEGYKYSSLLEFMGEVTKSNCNPQYDIVIEIESDLVEENDLYFYSANDITLNLNGYFVDLIPDTATATGGNNGIFINANSFVINGLDKSTSADYDSEKEYNKIESGIFLEGGSLTTNDVIIFAPYDWGLNIFTNYNNIENTTRVVTLNNTYIYAQTCEAILNEIEEAEIYINDSTIISGEWSAIYNDGGYLMITGDTYVCSEKSITIDGEDQYSNNAICQDGGTIIIVDGTFISGTDKTGTAIGLYGSYSFAFVGGSYNSDMSAYIKSTYQCLLNSDGLYEISIIPVAKIGDVEYGTITAAISAAEEYDTIVLLGDISSSSCIFIQKSITLDLGGYTLTSTSTVNSAILLYKTGIDVTIKNGTIYTDTVYIGVWGYYGSLVLENMVIVNEYPNGTDGCWAVLMMGGTNLEITNSTITADIDNGIALQLQGSAIAEIGEGAVLYGKDKGASLLYSAGAPYLTVQDGAKITGNYAIYVGGGNVADYVTTLIINGGIIGDENSTNAVIGNGAKDYTYIEINGGTVTGGQNMAISHPQSGDLIITGGTIIGPTGIQYGGSGNLSITGGTIIGTDEEVVLFKDSADSDGAIAESGSALLLASRGDGYQDEAQAMNVFISGDAVLQSYNNPVLYVLKMSKISGVWTFNDESQTNYLESLVISGGTFLGGAMNIESDALGAGAISVSGGAFESFPEYDSYTIINKGYSLSETALSGYYTVVSTVSEEASSTVDNILGLTEESESDAINSAAAEIVSYDKTALAEDTEIVEAINTLDSLFATANNITVEENKITYEDLEEDELKLPSAEDTQESAISGLALAVYGDVEEVPSDVSVYIEIVQKSATDSKSDFVLEITPYQTVSGETSVIDNASISVPVTFDLYLPTEYAASKVVLKHIFDDQEALLYGKSFEEYILTVQTDVNGNKYVTVTVTHFSAFEISEYVVATSSSSNITIDSKYTVAGTSVSAGDADEDDVDVDEEMAVEPETDTDTEEEASTPVVVPTTSPSTTDTSSSSSAWIWIVLGVLAIGGVIGFVVYKKKQS